LSALLLEVAVEADTQDQAVEQAVEEAEGVR